MHEELAQLAEHVDVAQVEEQLVARLGSVSPCLSLGALTMTYTPGGRTFLVSVGTGSRSRSS